MSLPAQVVLSGGYIYTTHGTYQSFNLSGVSLAGANLTGSTFHNSSFTNVDFTGANMSSTDITNITWNGGNIFTNANFSGANQSYAKYVGGNTWSNTTCPNGVVQNSSCW